MLKKFLNPKIDICFKKIFGVEANLDTLTKGFLNSVLNLKNEKLITHLELLETVQKPEIASRKESSVDVIVKDQSGDRYIIEMQIAQVEGFEKRAQYYASRVYLNNFTTGGRYKNISRVIFLAITNYVLFPNKKAYKSRHKTLDTVTYDHDLKDFEYTFVELPKFEKTIDQAKQNIEDSWFYFFKHADENYEPIEDLLKLPHIKDAYEIVKTVNWSEAELQQYQRQEMNVMDEKGMVDAARKEGLEEGIEQGIEKGMEQGIEKGREEGIEKGREEGAYNKQLDIVRNLKKMGLSVEQIIKATGLSKAAIDKL